MSGAFAVLCAPDGMVLDSFGQGKALSGTLVSGLVARDSRERLLQMLRAAQESAQHSVLQMADGLTLEVHCVGEMGQTLLVAAPTAAEILQRCHEIEEDGLAGSLARRLLATARPDDLSLDLWSELAQLNNELATTQRQLAKNNAELRWLNEHKNQLLGIAAHDLRNPLAAVLGYAQFLMAGPDPLSEEQQRMLHRVEVNVHTMLGMVEDVLDFSAIESGTVRRDLSDFTPDTLIAEVAETNELIAERKSIRIAVSVADALPLLRADRPKLMQVLNNLVTNAIKFSHGGSTVTIAAGARPEGGVWISVTDRGVGMSPEQTARLFEPFGRVGVKGTAGETSTGLGLAIVKRIVEAHHGRVEVESATGVGTTFTVILPAGEE